MPDFVYAQRTEDVVLEAQVRKTETISAELGSAGQVLGERIHLKLAAGGITRRTATALARDIDADTGRTADGLPVHSFQTLLADLANLLPHLDLSANQISDCRRPAAIRYVRPPLDISHCPE